MFSSSLILASRTLRRMNYCTFNILILPNSDRSSRLHLVFANLLVVNLQYECGLGIDNI